MIGLAIIGVNANAYVNLGCYQEEIPTIIVVILWIPGANEGCKYIQGKYLVIEIGYTMGFW